MTAPAVPASLDEVLAFRHPAVITQPAAAGWVMTEEIEKRDWMWHTFLLFTHDYAAFCDRYIGYFLHHVPADEADEPPSPEALRGQLERQYALVYDVLGEQTLLAWYDECRYAASA